jgi:queuine tRNA-ribosyltransferase
MSLAGFEISRCADGSATLRDPASGCDMHSAVGPLTEAREIYARPSRLAERLLGDGPELVLWDVGLGIAANAIVALEEWQALAPESRRELRIVSFESDLGGLRSALSRLEEFAFLAPHETALRELLGRGEWRNGGVSWSVLEGDWFETLARAPAPELVYFDFYAPPKCPRLWSLESFERLREAARPRLEQGLPTDLYTYSASTPVRTALLLAGLYVGYSARTEMKNESTFASTLAGRAQESLGDRWLHKFECSSRRMPWGMSPDREDEVARRVRAHPQFRGGAG